jgi:hypothetical protein
VITFANDYIRKAVEDRHLPTEEDKRAAHRWLGEWFEGREVTLDVAQERVHQWRQAEDKDRLRSCLLEEPVFEELYKHDKYALLRQWLWLGEDIETAYREATECWAKFNHGDDLKKFFIYEILAGFLQLAGSYSNYVEALLSDSIFLSKRHCGEKNERTFKLIYGLANLFFHRRDDGWGESIKLLELVHSMMEESLGRNHPDTIKVGLNVAELLWNFGDFSRSEKVATESIRLSLEIGDLASQRNLRCAYLLMSLCSKKKNNHNDAIYYLQGAHDISTALFGEKSFEFAVTGLRLGLQMGDEIGLNMCFKAINLTSTLMGETHGFTKNATQSFIQKFGMYELARASIVAGEVVKCKYWIQKAIDRRGDDKERAILDLDFLPIKNFIKSL